MLPLENESQIHLLKRFKQETSSIIAEAKIRRFHRTKREKAIAKRKKRIELLKEINMV